MWTEIVDHKIHGGIPDEPDIKFIYIQQPPHIARKVFENRFGVNPDEICASCGPRFSKRSVMFTDLWDDSKARHHRATEPVDAIVVIQEDSISAEEMR